jgi:hypothetical protein
MVTRLVARGDSLELFRGVVELDEGRRGLFYAFFWTALRTQSLDV